MPVTLRQRVAKRARQRPAAEPRSGSGSNGDGGGLNGSEAGTGSDQETCAKRVRDRDYYIARI